MLFTGIRKPTGKKFYFEIVDANGNVVGTRKSFRKYVSATVHLHKDTNKVWNITYSTKLKATSMGIPGVISLLVPIEEVD